MDSITNTSVFDFLLDIDEDIVHCSTNPAVVHSRGHPPGSVVAPPPPDVERPLPTSTTPAVAPSAQDVERPPSPTSTAAPHGCGLVPPSGSDVLLPRAGGCGPVPPPVAPRDDAGLVPSLPHFYTRRPAAPTSSTATAVPSAASPPASAPADPPAAARPMTRTQTGTIPRVQYKGLITATVPSPVPSNYRSGLADPNWCAAMAEEYKALIDNDTWRLVPRPPGANVVTGKWIFTRDGFGSDTHGYEFGCHYLPHFISNSDTNTNIIEYGYKTDISNSDSHSNTYSIYNI
jgi:hypothetical protein